MVSLTCRIQVVYIVNEHNRDSGSGSGNLSSNGLESRDMLANKKTVVVELSYPIAAAVCYILNGIAPALWLYSEPKENRFVRYHAVQALSLILIYIACSVVLGTISSIISLIPVLGLLSMVFDLVNGVLALAYFGVCIRLALGAAKGKPAKLPVVSKYIEQAMDQYNL